MKHILPELPFSYDALEPTISSKTLQTHYEKHHAGYIEKLNSLIDGTEYRKMTLEELILRADGPIFNNAAQAWNHGFYWNSLAPLKKGEIREPEGLLAQALDRDFGSLTKFQKKFTEVGSAVFGSGWVWLVKNPEGRLAIEKTSNAENPMTKGATPLLTCDVWEHAYYLDYKNDRTAYLNGIWSVLHWKFAEFNLAAAQHGLEIPHNGESSSDATLQ